MILLKGFRRVFRKDTQTVLHHFLHISEHGVHMIDAFIRKRGFINQDFLTSILHVPSQILFVDKQILSQN